MNEAEKANQESDVFLQRVRLKNYKSIIDAEINFKPGLNIIIGNNGSGKTNFINGLNTALQFKRDVFSDFEYMLNAFFESDKITIETLNQKETKIDFLSEDHYSYPVRQNLLLNINDEQIDIESTTKLKDKLSESNHYFLETIIRYGIQYTENAAFINIPFSFVLFNNGKVSGELMSNINTDNQTKFIQSFFYRLYLQITRIYNGDASKDNSIVDIKKQLITFSERCFKKINNQINTYSPIQAIRLNPDFNLINEEISQKQTITNFYLEFLVDQKWLTFSLLSDGTKRLFYIISEALGRDSLILIEERFLNIILLEEPELGIHPHQLHKLMLFIKEQSKEKQIILTTHSPQVLNILNANELDRIIICSYDKEKGTQLNHLTETQIKKGQMYMQDEGFLSDYWVHSDLESAS